MNVLVFLLILCSNFEYTLAKVYKLKEFEDILDRNLNVPDCDFDGTTIKGLTVLYPPLTAIDPHQVESLTFDNQTQSYDITQFAHGLIIQIIQLLSQACNFNYDIHLGRHVYEFGTVNHYPNGTIQGTGLFDYFVKPTDFDIIWADLNYSPERFEHIDALPPFSYDRLALVIRNDFGNNFDPWMFINPIKIEVWMTILGISISIASFISIHNHFLDKQSFALQDLLKKAVQGFSSNFGGDFLSEDFHKSARIAAFAVFTFGLLVWNYYQSYIISGLAKHKPNYPFNNLEGLAQSNYFLTTSSANMGLVGKRFYLASPGSIEEQIFANNMNTKESFIGTPASLKLIQEQHGIAHFTFLKYILQEQQRLNIPFCDLVPVWKAPTIEGTYFALRKNSKYFPGLKRQMMKLIESGQLTRLEEIHYKLPSRKQCNPEVAPVGMDKLCSLFILLVSALVTSLFVLFFDFLKVK